MSCNKYKTTEINSKECIGDSLEKINNNFLVLRNAYCDIRTELNNRLRVMNQSIPLPEYTETIIFSGTRVSVRAASGDNPYDFYEGEVGDGTYKSVYIPVTGVTRILAGSYITLESSQPQGRGVVTVNFDLPPRPKQIRTFMFTEDGQSGAMNRPSYTRLQSFINSRLKIGVNENIPITTNSYSTDVSRENDEIYIIYFKTARNNLTIAAAGSQAYTGFKAQVTNISFGGSESGRASSQGIKDAQTGSYTASWPSDTAERSVLVTITYKFRYTGTEYVPVISDSTGQWPKYSYSIHAEPPGQVTEIGPPSDISVPVPDASEEVIRFYNVNTDPFIVPAGVSTIEILVIGAGGGGGIAPGKTAQSPGAAGGGGAGGYYYNPTFQVRPGGVYSITVGKGGTAGTNNLAQNGGNTEFTLVGTPGTNDSIFVRGGGAGANGPGTIGSSGASGGGGAGKNNTSTISTPGTPTTSLTIALPTSVPQGNQGGFGERGRGGGGGGFGGNGSLAGGVGSDGVGGNAASTTGGAGGPGKRIPDSAKTFTGQIVCAGGAGGVDNTLDSTNYTQLADPPAGNGSYKYGCGGGAGRDGSDGIIGIAYKVGL